MTHFPGAARVRHAPHMAPYDLLTLLLAPLGTALAGGLLAAALALQRWRRAAWACAVLSIAWLLVFSLPVTSHALRAGLEADYPPQAAERLPTAGAIVILGGGITPPHGDRLYPNLPDSADRIWHAARLYHAGRAPLLVASGGFNPIHSDTPEAQAMAVFLHDLGVPASAVLAEDRSRSTRENAQFTAALLRERSIEDILLVTSAAHMARAVPLFEAQGLRVVPAATDHAGRPRAGGTRWLPNAHALADSGDAIKEYLGRWGRRWGF